jgi:2-phosphoglycerate kinase
MDTVLGLEARMDANLRVILIGGTSHVGKSTLARRLAERLGWDCRSTDLLARHPGRPWRPPGEDVPAHVAEYYLELTDEARLASVLAHYHNIWPLAEALVRRHAGDPSAEGLVLEGSALWPDLVAGLPLPSAAAVWLTGSVALIETRIRSESRYAEADTRGRAMIETFIERSRRFDRLMMGEVRRLGLAYVEVATDTDIEALADRCLATMRPLA